MTIGAKTTDTAAWLGGVINVGVRVEMWLKGVVLVLLLCCPARGQQGPS